MDERTHWPSEDLALDLDECPTPEEGADFELARDAEGHCREIRFDGGFTIQL
jgi:hypothetical protein